MKNRRPRLLFALALLTACGGSDSPIDPGGNNTPTVATVIVTPNAPTIVLGATQQFTAQARDANGGSLSGLTVSWSSSSAAIATVSSTGLVTGVGLGTSAITATAGGVAGSQVLTVEADQCDQATTVSLSPGGYQSFPTSQCLLLPAGSSGDRYRVVIARPSDVEDASDVSTATLSTTQLSTLSSAAAQLPAPTRVAADMPEGLPRLDATPFLEAARRQQATSAYHVRLREQERELLERLGPNALAPDRRLAGLARVAAGAPSPDKIQLDPATPSDCTAGTGAEVTAILVGENDDLAIYQDSTQRASKPISVGAVNRALTYYSAYARDMVRDYFGPPSDIDGNGKIVLFVSPVVDPDVAGFVYSGDFATKANCAASNEMELIFFNVELMLDMDDPDSPNFQALETVAHEAKHVVSLRNRFIRSGQLHESAFHPLWIEEGTAEISGNMSSRIAWAATGGPAVGAKVTATDILTSVQANGGAATPEMWGVIVRLVNTILYYTSQPNAVTGAADGAAEGHTFYGSGWNFHRWLGDAYGNASTALADAPLFKAMADSLAGTGSAAIVEQAGKSFAELFEEFVVAVGLNGVPVPQPERAITTMDFVTATSVFSGPETLTPDGFYPWPVTITDKDGTPKGFTTASYTGPIGLGGVRYHDLQSSGSNDVQVEADVEPPAKVIVIRIR